MLTLLRCSMILNQKTWKPQNNISITGRTKLSGRESEKSQNIKYSPRRKKKKRKMHLPGNSYYFMDIRRKLESTESGVHFDVDKKPKCSLAVNLISYKWGPVCCISNKHFERGWMGYKGRNWVKLKRQQLRILRNYINNIN